MMLMMMLVAAPISCADGVLMATSSVMMRNVIQANFPHLVPANRLLRYSRFFLVPVTILACVLAIVKPDPGDLLVLSFELVLAGCFVPLVLGIYWKKANSRAAFWAIMIPSILRVVLYFALPAESAGSARSASAGFTRHLRALASDTAGTGAGAGGSRHA